MQDTKQSPARDIAATRAKTRLTLIDFPSDQ